MATHDEFDLGDDLEISRVQRQMHGGTGTWVSGTLHGHRFEALVFPEHAECADWEMGDSRISKLLIRRIADKQIVFNWDRGMDIAAADGLVGSIVDFLCAGLADHTYAE
jgi:hypothetical protein